MSTKDRICNMAKRTSKHCCCYCIPLRYGCFIIGALEIIPWVGLIVIDIAVMSFMRPDPNEDDENRNQRQTVRYLYISHLLRCIAFIFFGIFIIVITFRRCELILKFAAIAEVALFVCHLFVLIVTPYNSIVGRFVVCWMALSLWRLYSAAVMYSYAIQLEEEEDKDEEEDATLGVATPANPPDPTA